MTKLLVTKLYTIEIESEICCELCCEIIHNHIAECPICHTKFASTDSYHNLEEDNDTYIQCDECDSYLQIVDGSWYGIYDEEDLLTYKNEENSFAYKYAYENQYPKVILVETVRQIDPPVSEIKETKNTYTLYPKTFLW